MQCLDPPQLFDFIFSPNKKGAFGGYLKQMFWLYILHVLWTSHTHIKPEICLQNVVPSRRSRMLLNIRSECLYSTFQSHVNDKTGFWSSTSVPFLISLSSCNLSTVGCWDCKSISGFSRQLNVILERGVTPTLSYLPAFKSWKEMPTNLGSFMQPSPLIYSSLNHIFEHKKKKTCQSWKAKNREAVMSMLQREISKSRYNMWT